MRDRNTPEQPHLLYPDMEGAVISLNEFPERELHWLWYPYIPKASVTLLYGPPGVGKSYVSYAIASALSRGLALPGQEESTPPMNVMLISVEDNPSLIIKPRVRRMGGDQTRIFIPNHSFTVDERGLADLKRWIVEMHISLVFIDPLTLYMGGKTDLHRMNQVYEIFGQLQRIADEMDITIVVVHHSRKGEEGSYLDRAAGSQAIAAGIRSGLYVHEEDGTKIVSHAKHNYSPQGRSLTFTLEGNEGRFIWGAPLDEDPAAFSGSQPAEGRQRRGKASEKAVVFLKAFLANGAVPAKELLSAAEDEGFSIATLNRVKPGVAESFCMRKFGQTEWYWRLVD